MTELPRADVLPGLLEERLAADSGAEGLVFPEARLTWRELADRADRLARALVSLGVEDGDKVAVMLPNSALYAVAILGTALAGATSVPINLRFKETELGHVVADCDARVLLTAGSPTDGPDASAAHGLLPSVFPDLAEQEPRALQLHAAPCLTAVLWLDGEPLPGTVPPDEVAAAAEGVDGPELTERRGRMRADAPAMIMYTSGTTASPKGAVLTHRAVVAQARCVGAHCYGLTRDDRFWTPLPMFHTGGLMSLLACLAAGATYIHARTFEAGRALHQLSAERVTVAMPVFEPLWLPVLDHPDFASTDLSALRIVQTAGVPEKQRIMQERLPTAVNMQSSGMTETASYFAFNRPTDPPEVRLTTGGYPMPTVEVRVVDRATGEDAPAGTHGETLLRGVGCFVGYHNAPELTEAVIDRDGWFHTGDVGVLDEAGRYTFVGRIKDMLKVGGENVAAAEVEDYLSRHPAVRLVQVVAAPDRRYGEVPAAFVELNDGAVVTEKELIEYCVGRIATFKVPRYVRFVTEWPMSGTKIRKFRLREELAKELSEKGITEAPRLSSRAGVA
ncbi:AMP-binding protein [Streptomyces carpinensis]|nr:AMP-binding protein [Streptomyces carpinensis]